MLTQKARPSLEDIKIEVTAFPVTACVLSSLTEEEEMGFYAGVEVDGQPVEWEGLVVVLL